MSIGHLIKWTAFKLNGADGLVPFLGWGLWSKGVGAGYLLHIFSVVGVGLYVFWVGGEIGYLLPILSAVGGWVVCVLSWEWGLATYFTSWVEWRCGCVWVGGRVGYLLHTGWQGPSPVVVTRCSVSEQRSRDGWHDYHTYTRVSAWLNHRQYL